MRRKNEVIFTEQIGLLPTATQSVQTTADAVLSLSDIADFEVDGKKPVKAEILIVTNGSRYAYAVDPVSGGLGYPLAADESITLIGEQEIDNFRIINETAAQQVTFYVTFFYQD